MTARKFDIYNRANDLSDVAYICFFCGADHGFAYGLIQVDSDSSRKRLEEFNIAIF